MSTDYNKLAMSWNVAIESDEDVLSIVVKYGGETVSYSKMGRGRLLLAEFPDNEQAHQCLLSLEMMEMHVELFVPTKVHLN